MPILNSICIIPARSGSKRIKNKNIKKFLGKPIISYSIKAAKKSGCFNKIIVSTDSVKISKIAIKYGADVPFIRSKKLSNDRAMLRPVIKDALLKIIKIYGKPKYICYITSTAPLLMIKDLKYGYQKIKKRDAKIVFAITEYKYPTQRALKINKNEKIEMISSKYRFVHSQNLEKTFHDAGLFYWAKTDEILKNTPTLSKNSYPIIIPNYRAVDIDDKNDWKSAEVAYKAFIKK
tara:strand:- start:25026 stop:25727 length:702 start_codon:yes stop_codon:yes gene_type:complete